MKNKSIAERFKEELDKGRYSFFWDWDKGIDHAEIYNWLKQQPENNQETDKNSTIDLATHSYQNIKESEISEFADEAIRMCKQNLTLESNQSQFDLGSCGDHTTSIEFTKLGFILAVLEQLKSFYEKKNIQMPLPEKPENS